MRTWVNGRLLSDPEAPVVGANDHGLTVGDGVFEVLKVVDGQLFALDQHLARLKTTSYGENVRALARAREKGASEAVFANLQGHLCEGTGTNIFYVVDGELRTPTLASGCLAGITRALLLEWYGGVEVDEPIEVVEQASEVFLVSTTRDVQAVARWDDRELPAPGRVTTEAAEV